MLITNPNKNELIIQNDDKSKQLRIRETVDGFKVFDPKDNQQYPDIYKNLTAKAVKVDTTHWKFDNFTSIITNDKAFDLTTLSGVGNTQFYTRPYLHIRYKDNTYDIIYDYPLNMFLPETTLLGAVSTSMAVGVSYHNSKKSFELVFVAIPENITVQSYKSEYTQVGVYLKSSSNISDVEIYTTDESLGFTSKQDDKLAITREEFYTMSYINKLEDRIAALEAKLNS